MAASRARVRMFSDDGRCVHDPVRHAPGAGVRLVARRRDRPARRGPPAHRGRAGPRGRRRGAARAGRLAGRPPRRRSSPATARWPARPGRGCTSATCPSRTRSRCCGRRRPPACGSPPRSPRTTCCSPTRRCAGYDPVHKVNPPLRTGDDTAAMRAALAEGVIDVVATDHAPHAAQYKDTEWAAARPGMLGLQTALSVVVRACVEPGLLDWRGVARVMSERPAEIGGLADQGRPIAVGRAGDVLPRRPRRDLDGARRGAGQPGVEHALRGHAAAGDGGRDGAARSDHGARREGRAARRDGRRMTGPALLVLEDGRVFRGERYGAVGQSLGEAVFCTAMTGYQETLTDPSYHGQIVVATAPQIGNTGWNDEDDESARIQVAGYVVRDPSRTASSWRSRRSLDDALERPGDRRRRRDRHPRAGPAPARAGRDEGRRLLRGLPSAAGRRAGRPGALGPVDGRRRPLRRGHHAARVRRPRRRRARRFRVAALDVGIKSNTPRMFAARGVETHVLPAHTPIERIEELAPDGFFLANGPGDPATADVPVALTRQVLERRIPLFGICFGNQILGRALGRRHLQAALRAPGHQHPGRRARHRQGVDHRAEPRVRRRGRGGGAVRHPVRPGARSPTPARTTAASRAWRCSTRPAFSVQYHPEAAAGPARRRGPVRPVRRAHADGRRTTREGPLMPRRDDLRHVLVIGSGPIVIGQAAEFDYSGTQACRVLRAEGLRVVAGQLQPGDDHDGPRVRRRHLRRAGHPGVRREGDRRRAPRRDPRRPSAGRPR